MQHWNPFTHIWTLSYIPSQKHLYLNRFAVSFTPWCPMLSCTTSKIWSLRQVCKRSCHHSPNQESSITYYIDLFFCHTWFQCLRGHITGHIWQCHPFVVTRPFLPVPKSLELFMFYISRQKLQHLLFCVPWQVGSDPLWSSCFSPSGSYLSHPASAVTGSRSRTIPLDYRWLCSHQIPCP